LISRAVEAGRDRSLRPHAIAEGARATPLRSARADDDGSRTDGVRMWECRRRPIALPRRSQTAGPPRVGALELIRGTLVPRAAPTAEHSDRSRSTLSWVSVSRSTRSLAASALVVGGFRTEIDVQLGNELFRLISPAGGGALPRGLFGSAPCPFGPIGFAKLLSLQTPTSIAWESSGLFPAGVLTIRSATPSKGARDLTGAPTSPYALVADGRTCAARKFAESRSTQSS